MAWRHEPSQADQRSPSGIGSGPTSCAGGVGLGNVKSATFSASSLQDHQQVTTLGGKEGSRKTKGLSLQDPVRGKLGGSCSSAHLLSMLAFSRKADLWGGEEGSASAEGPAA